MGTTLFDFMASIFNAKLSPALVMHTFLIRVLNRDLSVLLDMLLDNETHFLRYLLRFIHYYLDRRLTTDSLKGLNIEEESDLLCVLQHLRMKVESAFNSNLFPYNTKPLLKALSSLEQFMSF